MTNYVGQKFGNYTLLRLLGQGGFAHVYLGEHIYLKTYAAIKILQTRLANNNQEDFLQEARTIASLIHPHIIRVLDFGVEGGIPFLVMDPERRFANMVAFANALEHASQSLGPLALAPLSPNMLSSRGQPTPVLDPLPNSHNTEPNPSFYQVNTEFSSSPRLPVIGEATSADTPAQEMINVRTPRLPLSRRSTVLGLLGLGGVVLVGSTGIAWFTTHTTPHPSPTTPLTSPPIGNLLYTYKGHQDKVVAVGWSPDGKRIASGSWDQTAQVWDALTGKHVVTYRGHTKAINSLAWSPDGKAIVTSSLDGTAQVWNAATVQQIARYSGHAQGITQYGVSAVAWSPKSNLIASAGDDKTVQVWTADMGKRVYPPLVHSAIVRCVAWSPNGHYIASGSFDDQVLVWQIATGTIMASHKHTAHVCSVAWSPDGQYIVSASDDRKVQVWKWNTPAQPPFTFDDTIVYQRVDSLGIPHPKPASEDDFYAPGTNVFAVAWSPNGKRIASVDEGGYMFTWDALSTGDNLSLHNGDFHFVNAVAWAPDGKHVATGNDSFQVQIWLEG